MTIQIVLFILFGIICIWMLSNQLTKKKKISSDVFFPPVTSEPEMPIKPIPVNCQKASFRPAPEKFSYTNCCGIIEEGEGFQPWEKRSPVSIDVNQPFEGMDLIGEDGVPCE